MSDRRQRLSSDRRAQRRVDAMALAPIFHRPSTAPGDPDPAVIIKDNVWIGHECRDSQGSDHW
jgi:hypothetical protein